MLLITIIILIILIVYLLHNNISIQSLLNLNLNLKEGFVITVKDRQKIGTSDMEDGRQPKSTWKSGNVNYESCYTTETRNGNSTGRKGSYYCNNGIDGGEVIPAEGLYCLDLSNYTVHPGKAIRGKPLTGTYSSNNSKSYSINDDGIVNGETLTLAQSKSLCDSLKDKCLGFIMIIPVNGGYQHQTIFISKIDEGWEDPDTYAKFAKLDDTNTNLVSYVKKDPFAIEKGIPQQQINATSEKYRNLPTCNWKSANRCIFSDYTYDQPSNSCVSKDGNPAFNVVGYTREQLTDWLKTMYNRDMGVNKLTSEAVNVRNYIERCKDVDDYEFLATLNLPNPYTPTKNPGDVKGRYVRISINNKTNNWLHLAELQVISNNRNIGLGKPTSTSSVYGGASSNRANDGNNDGNFNNGSVSHTENTGNPEFWEVDLGDSSQTIDRIIVSNRTDGGGERLNNWLLSIYDNNKNLVWARIYTEAPNPRSVIDILQAHNDMSNIRVKDYNQSKFNNYFYRVSDTEYNSKRGWDGKGCYAQCHKEICEGDRKKWIGNNDWYGCREYRPGEYEAEQEEKRRIEQELLEGNISLIPTIGSSGSSQKVCCSEDGNVVYQTTLSVIHVSRDGGKNFQQTSSPSTEWTGISCNHNGSFVLASTWGGGMIYQSNNYGGTWNNTGFSGGSASAVHIARGLSRWNQSLDDVATITWFGGRYKNRRQQGDLNRYGLFYPDVSIASSDDGNIVYITCGGMAESSYKISNNNVLKELNIPKLATCGIACSSVGNIAYISQDGGFLYKSNNAGESWTPYTELGNKRWRGLCCSGNGQVVTVCTYGDGIYHSKDGGAKWSVVKETRGINFKSATCSFDGSKTFVCINQGPVFYLN